jgi:hypothetical protein
MVTTPMLMRGKIPALLLAALLAGAGARQDEYLRVDLRPEVSSGAVTAIAVSQELGQGPSLDFRMVAPVVYPGAPGVADRLVDLVVTDAAGAVPLVVTEDAAVPGGFPYYRHWRASRSVSYPLKISYRALVMPPQSRGGPPFGIRAVGGGVVGAGPGFLLLPDIENKGRITVNWDLAAFGTGAIASSSFGDGSFTLQGSAKALNEGWFLAGPAGIVPFKNGFGATWLGTPTFDAVAAMETAARGYRYLASTFPHLRPTPPYRVFMQFRPEKSSGGTALLNSFMFWRGPLAPDEVARVPLSTIFHEMIHQWVGQIEGPVGVISWFSEGLTSYYEHELPMRGGFISLADYEASINRVSEDYETSKARNWSARKIAEVGFADEEVRHTPYRRSELYFHDLDARIRAKSRGKRNLDDLVFSVFRTRERGQVFDEARWIAMVVGELGPAEEARFRGLIIDGVDTLEPREDSFGPCYTKVAATYQRNGATVTGHRWVRNANVPDATCLRY